MNHSKVDLMFRVSLLTYSLLFPPFLWAQAYLEDPTPGSSQGGIGLVRGWVCRASRVDIVFDDQDTFQAAYGTSREDTRSVCGTGNTGFGLLFNWNLLGDGTHTVRALADGVEFGSATITVTTLGAEFLRGKSGTVSLFDFPQAGTELSLVWQESKQTFAIESVTPNSFVKQLSGRTVLWVGAHPDDEATIAPLLGDLCVERGAQCTFLVATHGESGSCKLSGGCQPDLATVRTQEMRNAAALYGANLMQWDLPDGSAAQPDTVLKVWAGISGGDNALVGRMASAILTVNPDIILIFDPRHGTTCHSDHRAIAALTLSALNRLDPRPAAAYLLTPSAPIRTVYLVETRLQVDANGSPKLFSVAVPGDTAVRGYDANQQLPRIKDTAWAYLLLNLQAHPSQFSTVDLEAVRSTASESRQVSLLPWEGIPVEIDRRYSDICPP